MSFGPTRPPPPPFVPSKVCDLSGRELELGPCMHARRNNLYQGPLGGGPWSLGPEDLVGTAEGDACRGAEGVAHGEVMMASMMREEAEREAVRRWGPGATARFVLNGAGQVECEVCVVSRHKLSGKAYHKYGRGPTFNEAFMDAEHRGATKGSSR